MESGSGSETSSSVVLRTGPPPNLVGGDQFNSSEKKPGVSFSPFTSELASQKDQFHQNPSFLGATSPTNDQTNRTEAHFANPFGEPHPSPLGNYSSPSSLPSSQNPFLLKTDATNSTHVSAFESEKLYADVPSDEMPHSSLAPISTTSPGNPFQVPTTSTSDTNPPPKLGKDSLLPLKSSDGDMPISSMPKHRQQQSSDVAGKYSSQIQNPPVQVMERTEDPVHRIPLDVFSRNKSNNQWSTASNDSLFSIHMGNTSFSNNMAWWSKSGEFDKQTPSSSQTPETYNFNNNSQSSAKQHQGLRVTEEKAAETMREVLKENSLSKKNTCECDMTIADGGTRSNRLYDFNNHSHHSDGSTKSFAFKVLTDVDKTLSPKKHVEELQKQQEQPEMQTFQERSNAPQNPKSTPNVSQNRWLSCFACCH